MVRLRVVVVFHLKRALMRLQGLMLIVGEMLHVSSQHWDLNVMRPCHQPQRSSDGTAQTLIYKDSAISPHRVSLNKPTVDMNNVPFK